MINKDRETIRPYAIYLLGQSPCPDERMLQTGEKVHQTSRVADVDRTSRKSFSKYRSDPDFTVEKNANVDNKIKGSWWSRRTSQQKLVVKISVVLALLIVVCVVAIIPPVLLSTSSKRDSQSSIVNMHASVCTSTTCIGKETPYRTSMATLIYPFDGNVNDVIQSVLGAVIGNNPMPYTTYCYVGNQALYLNYGSNIQQHVRIPYINLSERSFTIEFWLSLNTAILMADYGIFSQCDSNSICLSISLRNGRFTLSFDSMNLNSTTVTGTAIYQPHYWVHVAFIYDSQLQQQYIYVNGQLDGVSRNVVTPFRGSSSLSETAIGRGTSATYGTTYIIGRIDHLTISAGSARTACQIYNDAILVAYFPFDAVNTWYDHSVNLFHGMSGGLTTLVPGRIGEAVYFGSNESYFQSKCLTFLKYSNAPFTVAFWINAVNPINGGSLIHISNLQTGNGSECYDLLALSPTGNLIVQLLQSSGMIAVYEGPVMSSSVWVHVAIVYEQIDGVRFYIDGHLSYVSLPNSTINLSTSPTLFFLTLANNKPSGAPNPSTCSSGTIPFVSGPFMGAIDDFRLYNRELSIAEVCTLANM